MNALLAFTFAILTAAPSGVTATRKADRDTITLSQSLAVTLTLEGPAPLRIEPPANWLSEPSAEIWRVSQVEPAVVTPLPGDREQWSIVLHAEPFIPGDVDLQFASASVTAGGEVSARQISWDGLEVRVVSTLKDQQVEARPITGIETLPPMSSTPTPISPDRLAVAIAMLLVASVMLILARRLRRRTRETALAWAQRELDLIGKEPSARHLDRLSQVMRLFLERESRIWATRLTTGELMLEVERIEGKFRDAAPVLRDILERCDAEKFARESIVESEVLRLLSEARMFVMAVAAKADAR